MNDDAPQAHDSDEKWFVAFLIFITIAMMWIALPFYGAVLWAIVASIVFRDSNRRMLTWTKGRRGLAAGITLFAIIFIVLVPLAAVSALLIDQAIGTYNRIQSQQFDIGAAAGQVWASVPDSVKSALARVGLNDIASFQARLSSIFGGAAQLVASRALSVGQSALAFVVSIAIMLYLTFFFLRDGGALIRRVGERIPLQNDRRRQLFDKFATVIRATVKGSIVVAIVQGVVGGITFWILGIEGPLLWGVVMAFMSLVPAVGSAIIWLPVALYLFATGDINKALIMVFSGAIIIGSVDNVLRPIMVGKDTRMPDYIVLIATLGGLSVIGINGLVIGPVIAALFIAAWDIFGDARNAEPLPEPPGHAQKQSEEKTA
jgi:predicted PurR-regulated permease PerM